MNVLWGVGGMAVLLAIAVALSTDARAIRLRTVGAALALQLGNKKIRVNAVCPSFTRSEMTDGMGDNEDLMEAFDRRMPLGAPAEADDIAGPILFLASDDARMVTGVNLPVDGGVSASNGQPNFLAFK